MKKTICRERFTGLAAFALLLSVSNAGMAESVLSNTGAWNLSGAVSTPLSLRIDDDLPDDWPPVDLPPLDDPEPQCPVGSRAYTIDNSLVDLLALTLSGSRLQISHTGRGEPLTGEPRTLNLKKGITASKFQQLEAAQEQRCLTRPDPGQCILDWYHAMNETVVHTIVPEYHSYVEWGDGFANLTGLEYTPVPVPVVEKPVQSTIAKAVTSALILPIAVNVDRARCYVNQIESTFSTQTHPTDIRNGRLQIGFPLDSGATPTLKCEGRAVALWGWHTWGWSDEMFPDVSLSNMYMNATIGGFSVVDGLPMYGSVGVGVDADIDLNNVPGFGESLISFFKDYSTKARAKVAAALRNKLMSDTVREAFGRALVGLVEQRSKDSIERVCDVRAAGDTIEVEYEVTPVNTAIDLDTIPELSVSVR